MVRKRTVISAVGTIGVLAATGITGTMASGADSHTTARSASSPPARLPAALSEHFAVLSSSAVPDAGPSAPVQITGPLVANFGLDASRAKRVSGRGGEVTYVVPGTGGICILVPVSTATVSGTQSACTSTANADAGNLQLMLVGGGDTTIIGLAPNNARTAVVNDANGATSTVAVTDNVYVVHDNEAQSMTVTGANGSSDTITVPR